MVQDNGVAKNVSPKGNTGVSIRVRSGEIGFCVAIIAFLLLVVAFAFSVRSAGDRSFYWIDQFCVTMILYAMFCHCIGIVFGIVGWQTWQGKTAALSPIFSGLLAFIIALLLDPITLMIRHYMGDGRHFN